MFKKFKSCCLSTLILISLLIIISSCQNNSKEEHAKNKNESVSTEDPLIFKLEKVVEGINAPLALENAQDGSGRIFIAEQAGKILILKPPPYLIDM